MTQHDRQAFFNAISFQGDIEDCDGVLKFTVIQDFDLAAAFQGIYRPEVETPPYRIAVPYCIADQVIVSVK